MHRPAPQRRMSHPQCQGPRHRSHPRDGRPSRGCALVGLSWWLSCHAWGPHKVGLCLTTRPGSGVLLPSCRRSHKGRGCSGRVSRTVRLPWVGRITQGGFRGSPWRGAGRRLQLGQGLDCSGCGPGLGEGSGCKAWSPPSPSTPTATPTASRWSQPQDLKTRPGLGWREGLPGKLFAQPGFNLQNRKAVLTEAAAGTAAGCQVTLPGPSSCPHTGGLPHGACPQIQLLPSPPTAPQAVPWGDSIPLALQAAGRTGARVGQEAGGGSRVTGPAGYDSWPHFANEEAEPREGSELVRVPQGGVRVVCPGAPTPGL